MVCSHTTKVLTEHLPEVPAVPGEEFDEGSRLADEKHEEVCDAEVDEVPVHGSAHVLDHDDEEDDKDVTDDASHEDDDAEHRDVDGQVHRHPGLVPQRAVAPAADRTAVVAGGHVVIVFVHKHGAW